MPAPAPKFMLRGMTETPDNLVLEHLRAIRGEVAETRRVIGEVRQRVANVEAMQGHLVTQYATLAARLDAMADDVATIRKRLGLIEA